MKPKINAIKFILNDVVVDFQKGNHRSIKSLSVLDKEELQDVISCIMNLQSSVMAQVNKRGL